MAIRPSVAPGSALCGLLAAVAALAAGAAAAAGAGPVLPESAVAQALALATQAAQAMAPPDARVVVQAGSLDARLQLAPCARIEAYAAAGAPAWGRTRVGLRCAEGAKPWNVFLPVTVQVWAPAAVATAALPAGATLQATAFTPGQTDWAAAPTLPYADGQALAGRVLSRPLAAGQALRMADLQPRRWFALGETVQVQLRGAGFAIDTQAVALTAGIEGQAARARTEAGRVLLGRPVAERRMELLW